MVSHTIARANRSLQAGNLEEAKRYFETACGLDPGNGRLLYYLGTVSLYMGDVARAVMLCRKATRRCSDVPEIYFGLGYALETSGHLLEAKEAYKNALRLKPSYGEALFNLGNIERSKGASEKAIYWYRKAIIARPEFIRAYINLAQALKSQGRYEECEKAIQTAIRIEGGRADLYCFLGEVLKARGRMGEAMKYVVKAARLERNFTRAYVTTAGLMRQRGKAKAAVAFLKKVYSRCADKSEVLIELGLASEMTEEYGCAKNCFCEVITMAPKNEQVRINLGRVYEKRAEVSRASRAYRSALMINRRCAVALNNLGAIMAGKGLTDGAITYYRKCISLEPSLCVVRYNLGKELLKRGHVDEAIRHLEKGIILNAVHAPSHNERGLALKQKGVYKEALGSFKKAIRIDNCFHQAYHNVGNLFLIRRKYTHAACYFKRAIELEPQALDSILALIWIYKKVGGLKKAIEMCERAESVSPENVKTWSSGLDVNVLAGRWEKANYFLEKLLTHRFSVEESDCLQQLLWVLPRMDVPITTVYGKFREYGALMGRRFERIAGSFNPNDYDKGAFRVGYISQDFRRHPVGYFARAILENHDPEEVETICYSLNAQKDGLTREIQDLCSRFRQVESLSERSIAHLIYDDRVNVLVDLAGHTNPTCLRILAMKPAPVIINHVGYASGTGLSTVDYKLTDYSADDADAHNHYVEKLLRIPGCAYPYVRRWRPSVPESRRAWGIPEDVVALGAFCPIFKLSPRVLSVWGTIINSVDNTVLLLSPEKQYRPYIVQMLARHNIANERTLFLDFHGDRGDARRYGVVDVFLDTFPYGGGMTSLDALNMHLPVVTLKGKRHGERMTYSILKNLGVPETIAHSEEEYVDIARRLVQHTDFRYEVKRRIAEGLKESQLVDMKMHVSSLEQGYKEAWRRFLKGNGPSEIRI